MDIETDFPRKHLILLSSNSFRGVSVIFVSSSIDYAKCIQAQVNNIIWIKQVKNEKVHNLSLFYILLKKVMSGIVSMKPKQKNIFKVPLHILPRPSKSILAKSKFFKKNQALNLL